MKILSFMNPVRFGGGERLMLDLKRASCEDSAALIEERIDLLAKGTEAFAAERMNQGILQALRGQHIESLK